MFLLNQGTVAGGTNIPATITNNIFTNITKPYVSEDQQWNGGFFVPGPSVDIVTGNTFPPPACFREGTHILTLRGHVVVEDLRIGDQVVLARGAAAPIRWIGYRTIDCNRHPLPAEIWPIRVLAGAFGPGMPIADLMLSPDHSVHVEGMLIPVRYLVNGRSIRQEQSARVTYYHVELPAHDVLLAEGLPCETYLDTGNRSAFANGGPAIQLHPDLASGVWSTKACAPMAIGGPAVLKARRRLLARAAELGFGITEDAAACLSIHGHRVRAKSRDDRLTFRVPRRSGVVRLLSRAAVPSHTRADSDEHRQLGVAVAQLWFDGAPVALDDARLGDGWYPVEQDERGRHWRWTDGNAALRLDGVREVVAEIAMTEVYWADETSRESSDRQRA